MSAKDGRKFLKSIVSVFDDFVTVLGIFSNITFPLAN